MSTMTVHENQIASAIASQLATRKRAFKSMLTRLADGAAVDADEMLDRCRDAGVSPDDLPAVVARVVKRRVLRQASEVAPEIMAARDAIAEEIKTLDLAESRRQAAALAAQDRYAADRHQLRRKDDALSHYFQEAQDAHCELVRTVDEALAAKQADLQKQRRKFLDTAGRIRERMKIRTSERAPDWEIGEFQRSVSEIENRIAGIDAELATIDAELHEIL